MVVYREVFTDNTGKSGFSWIARSDVINCFPKFGRFISVVIDQILIIVGFTYLYLLVYEIVKIAVGIPVVFSITLLSMF
jgi:hypothetical protein